jgi:hypothetical protein
MKTSRISCMHGVACASLLIVSVFTGTVAEADDDCSAGMKSCPVGTYQHIAKSDTCDPDPNLGKRGTCRPNNVPPDTAELVCLPQYPRTMNCHVWPQGPGLTYHFATQGGITALVTGSTPFPYQSFTCQSAGSSGVMHITVTAPSGVSSFASIPVSCTDVGWID